MSDKNNQNAKSNSSSNTGQSAFPFGFEFPEEMGIRSMEQLMAMSPLPGMERDFRMAVDTIRSIAETDFSVHIDLNNVCGHAAPGVEMKEGFCPACYESENIAELVNLLDMIDKFDDKDISETKKPSTSSDGQGASSSRASSSLVPSMGTEGDAPPPKKAKIDKEEPKKVEKTKTSESSTQKN
ncbi:unnamed protein product [Caenorhabditis sp. 36 PRJEB53466]|nr:unnamed protein product [Caenorhabditis sp. 36 PRJEB53466]